MATTPSFRVPTIDFGPYFADPTSAAAEGVVEQVREACKTTGFFQLVGHGISKELQAAVFRGSAALFALPPAEKQKLSQIHSVGASNRGYELIGAQGLQHGTLPDLKEGFYFGRHIPADDPRVQAHAFLLGPNILPDPAQVPEHVFAEPMTRYYEQMFGLSLAVLEVLARGLPYGADIFGEFTSNDAVAALRLLHYPPQPQQQPQPQPQPRQTQAQASSTAAAADSQLFGAGAHTDFGAVTLLLQDENPGLQVLDAQSGEWLPVPPDPDAYVVNIGDMLQMWTRGEYKSALHRVLNFSTKDRYSIPFFFDGNILCKLAPFDGSPVDGEVLTVESHMRERFASTYGRGKPMAEAA